MSACAAEELPKTLGAPSGGPPKPPRKTVRGLGDQSKDPVNEGDSSQLMAMVATHAQITWSELVVLNGGGGQEKREELETTLDRSVVALNKLARQSKRAAWKKAMDVLRFIRDYRH
jgi:hypothetical protein